MAQQQKGTSFQSKSKRGEGNRLRVVERICRLIAVHFQEPLSLKDIAECVNLHPNYAANVFKQELNITIHDYLTRLRLSHAQYLLATSDKKMLEIALVSGFGSANRFYIAFQKYCQCTPKTYRQRIQRQAT